MKMANRRTIIFFILLEAGAGILFMLLLRPALWPYWHQGKVHGPYIWWELLVFLNFSLSAAILAGIGRRRTFFLPALVSVAVLLVWPPPGIRLAPTPFPFGWLNQHQASPWWVRSVFVSATIGLILVLAPATVLAFSRPRTQGRRLDRADWASLGIVVALLCAAVVAVPHSGGGAVIVGQRLRGYWTLPYVVLFGVLLGTRKPWWPWVYLLLPFAGVWIPYVSGLIHDVTGGGLTGELLRIFRLGELLDEFLIDVAPSILVGLVAASWQPLSKVLRRWGLANRSESAAVLEGEAAWHPCGAP
jgi:hypothetical protein